MAIWSRSVAPEARRNRDFAPDRRNCVRSIKPRLDPVKMTCQAVVSILCSVTIRIDLIADIDQHSSDLGDRLAHSVL